jgi:hypothetical protein
MSDSLRLVRRLAALLAGSLTMVVASSASAQASYGEITHFGSKGTGSGQFESSEEASAIGVDPRDNSVYVVDLPDEKDEFRLQKFQANAEGQYKVVATIRFKPHDDEGNEEADTVEGVAVDPAKNRVYLMADEFRNPGRVKEVDGNDSAAAEIYAFSTVQSGETLVPASGTIQTGEEAGVLDGTKVLKPLSSKFGETLLEPSGITVDPATHELLVLAEEDPGSGEDRVDVQKFSESGEVKARWTDTTEALEDEGYSVAATASGQILVEGFEEIEQLPANFATGTPPTIFGQSGFELGAVEEPLVLYPGLPLPEAGGALSIGEEGTVYSRTGVAEQLEGQEAFSYPGILEFAANGNEEGWTGGQSIASVGEAGPCKIGGTGVAPQIAAGKEHKVFVLELNRLLKTPSDQVLEFGPGGSGCATAKATAPAASVNGQPVSSSEPIPPTDTVKFTSKLTQADALKVEWNFGDGTTETVTAREYQATEIAHQFKATGPKTVTEKITTDDLATPTIEVSTKVDIEGPAAVTGAPTALAKTSATLQGTVTPAGAAITECIFEYGLTTTYGKTAPCNPTELGTGTKPVAVSAAITGLAEATSYNYRVVAKYAGGSTEGQNIKFTTEPKPTVVTGAASGLTETAATINATVNPNGLELTSCVFQYGTSNLYGQTIPCSQVVGSGSAAVAVSATLSGLTPGTVYHYRITASNIGWPGINGNDGTFTTASPAIQPPPSGGGGGGGGGGGTTPGGGGVLNNNESKEPSPIATIAAHSTTATSAGAFTVKVGCPTGDTTCSGTVTIKTAKAVAASAGEIAKVKAAILTLASGKFSVAGGKSKVITLHLSAKARALLARLHVLSAKVTIVARNTGGASHTTTASFTLRAAKKKKH